MSRQQKQKTYGMRQRRRIRGKEHDAAVAFTRRIQIKTVSMAGISEINVDQLRCTAASRNGWRLVCPQ
eukprot:4820464-Pleurochrysis_carterae.AAC.2